MTPSQKTAPSMQDPLEAERLRPQFFAAAQEGDAPRVLECLQQAPQLASSYDHQGYTALMRAAQVPGAKGAQCVRALLPHVDARQRSMGIQSNSTALMIAAQEGTLESLEALLPVSDLNAEGFGNNTALDWAVRYHQRHCVNALVKKGAAAHQNASGQTALMVASALGDLECVELLLPGSPFYARSQSRRPANALEMAVENLHLDCVWVLAREDQRRQEEAKRCGQSNAHPSPELFLRAVRTIAQAEKPGQTQAVRRVEMLRGLLEMKIADPNEADVLGDTALMSCVQKSRLDLLLALLPHVDASQTNGLGDTALTYAAKGGWLDGVRALLEHDAQLARPHGNTPLMAAAAAGHIDCVKALLPWSQAHAQDEKGFNAAQRAIAAGQVECVDLVGAAMEIERARQLVRVHRGLALPLTRAVIERFELAAHLKNDTTDPHMQPSLSGSGGSGGAAETGEASSVFKDAPRRGRRL